MAREMASDLRKALEIYDGSYSVEEKVADDDLLFIQVISDNSSGIISSAALGTIMEVLQVYQYVYGSFFYYYVGVRETKDDEGNEVSAPYFHIGLSYEV